MITRRIVIASAVVAFGSACSSSKASPPTVLEGTVAPDGYPAPPTAVLVSDERGSVRSVALTPDGKFSTELAKGHSYRLDVATGRGVVPVVFPRRSGRLDTRFAIATSGARIALGQVRYRPAAPATGFTFTTTTSSTVRPATMGSGDGASKNENEVEDDDDVECHDGSHGHDDNVAQEGVHVDASAAMAVPQLDPPESAAGCDDDDDDDDDGEHGDHDGDHEHED